MSNNITTIADFIENFNEKKIMGYIWMTNEKSPKIYANNCLLWSDLKHNSSNYNQIQEAYVCTKEYTVRIVNSDGLEHVFCNKIDDFNDGNKYKTEDVKEYPSHIDGIAFLHFKQVYELKTSESGACFKQWQPIFQMFVGLTKKN